MSGHTPGPWEVEKESESHSIVNRSFDGDEWCIAEVYRDTDMAIANANLIAAAPCLLDALEELLAMALNLDEIVTSCRGPSDGTKVFDAAFDAIARAKGEQP